MTYIEPKYKVDDILHVKDKHNNYFLGKVKGIKFGNYYFDVYTADFVENNNKKLEVHFPIHLIENKVHVEKMNDNKSLIELLYLK